MRTRTLQIVKWVTLVGVVATVALVASFAWLFFGTSIQERFDRQQFNMTAWQDPKQIDEENVRIRMVDDLLKRHNFQGMTREQVTAVIGEPDQTGHYRDWELVYWLGPERSMVSIDSEWLVFRLDGKKRVTDYKIMRD